ncbi:MAG: MarR family transcriptional regulator [Clostridiales bacterium]|nr:MarR family transcriptional regulator [Clostridiales bacterium]
MVKNVHLHYEKNLNNIMAEKNMTVSQAMVLFFLKLEGEREINPIDIEKKFSLSRPTITGILKRLEAKGFIIFGESEKDRRYKQILLTEDGNSCLEEIDGMFRLMDNRLCDGFSEEEIEVVCRYLLRMISNLNEGETEKADCSIIKEREV